MHASRSPAALTALAATLASLGCSAVAGRSFEVDDVYSFVVLPDTQYYASSWPEVFAAQTQWIVENRDVKRIAFVLHTGDIVDRDVPEQWSAAADAMHVLDGRVPYVITSGNHDYGSIADRMGMGNTYFPPSKFAEQPWFGGTFEPDHIENSFSVLDVPGGRWLVIALEFGPRDEVLEWANVVLRAYADTPAIVVTHAYLYRDGTRYDHAGAPDQAYNPHHYVMMGQPDTTINDGAEMWTKLIEPNPNVRFVFSGHDVNGEGTPPGTAARLVSTRADGTVVHEILANYETCVFAPCAEVHGGGGYLRLVRVRKDDVVELETYSPYRDRSLEEDANRFVLSAP